MISAFAPATVANVAVGFDILGFALDNAGEICTAEKNEDNKKIIINPIDGYPDLNLNPKFNTAGRGLIEMQKDFKLNFGFKLTLKKNIPLGSGLGGSATSACAAVLAASYFLPRKLRIEELIHYALIGEEVASGSRHADNVAPCLNGGMCFVKSSSPIITLPIKIPSKLRVVVILPDLSIKTKDARSILSPTVPLKTVINQTTNLVGTILSLQQNKLDQLKYFFQDVMIEPQRSKLIPHFTTYQKICLDHGALGFSLSGSGPAMFTLTSSEDSATLIIKKLISWNIKNKVKCKAIWSSSISRQGAHIIKDTKKIAKIK